MRRARRRHRSGLPAHHRHQAQIPSTAAADSRGTLSCIGGRGHRPRGRCRRAGLPTADPGEPRTPSRYRRSKGTSRRYPDKKTARRRSLCATCSGFKSGHTKLNAGAAAVGHKADSSKPDDHHRPRLKARSASPRMIVPIISPRPGAPRPGASAGRHVHCPRPFCNRR
jgi:hypothetical protein